MCTYLSFILQDEKIWFWYFFSFWVNITDERTDGQSKNINAFPFSENALKIRTLLENSITAGVSYRCGNYLPNESCWIKCLKIVTSCFLSIELTFNTTTANYSSFLRSCRFPWVFLRSNTIVSYSVMWILIPTRNNIWKKNLVKWSRKNSFCQ